jgi:chemotaxis protein methyltransferase CheR
VAEKGLASIIERIAAFNPAVHKYRVSFLQRRIQIRMRLHNITDYVAYDAVLSSDPEEVAALSKSFSVNVTEFFRDANFFELFRSQLLPQIIDQQMRSHSDLREVKIWCAGCATGEEPYSLAILCCEMQNIMPHSSFKILATDISQAAVDFAKEAKYPIMSLKNIPQTLFAKYFEGGHNSGEEPVFQVSDKVRSLVTFNVGDIARVAPPSEVDVVCCRNVMIYFDSKAKDIMIQKFHGALKPGGFLAIGQSEALIGRLALSLFEPLYTRERTYRKTVQSTVAA